MYHIIVNPASKSGQGFCFWKELKKQLLANMITYTVQFTSGPMDAYKCVRKITNGDFAIPLKIIVLGGDGTLNEVLNGITDFDNTILTYLPTGSSNDLARAMGRSAGLSDFLSIINDHTLPAKMDYGLTRFKGGKRRFIVSCGIGFDAAVCEEVLESPLKKIFNFFHLGKLTYAAVALKQLMKSKFDTCDLYLDDSEIPIHIEKMLFCAFMNHKYEGGGFLFTPDAKSDDGLLDICVAGDIAKWRVPFLLPLALKGKHIGKKGIHIYQAKKVTIKTGSTLTVHTDGEICGHFDELTLSCQEKQLYCR